eukprot:CAMPEP_0174852938 /NCGR_PEP_ID=MMETSP1114-20130205/27278_1 /TAXON_ID=312471 /ORGANISM="Neobodo designis, Strain CCAP 1951/1" /LENGTH=316 /DNA_ID=CAMNT_0016087559 /DNA_START=39 /DNA_END=989 /DNA_ORIENTATION=+
MVFGSSSERKPSLYELRAMQRKLRVMNEKIHGPGANDSMGDAAGKDPYAVDDDVLANMTPFEQEELKLAMALRKFRDTMAEVDTCAKGKSADEQVTNPRLAKMRQQLRKMEMDLKPMQRSIASKATTEEEKRRAREALGHLNNMRKRYDRHRSAFQMQAFGNANAADPDLYDDRQPGYDTGSPAAPMLTNIDDVGNAGQNLREDEEFALFFEQIAKQDQRIDQALDRIHAGTLQLKENAMNINRELKVQQVLLDETEEKVAKTTERLTSLNKRVKKAVKDVEADRMCMYVICCVLMLGLVGFILYSTGVVGGKKKH